MATLDVLIPHFRDPDGLRASLKSVAEQTWPGNLRVMVFDDGSPQEDFLQARKAVEEFPRSIVLLRAERNAGRPVTRNGLLAAANAPYLAWLDAGDLWHPDKIRLQFEHLRRLECAGEDLSRIWVTCDYMWHVQGSSARRKRQKTEGDQLKELLTGDDLRSYLWTLLGRREAFQAVGRFDEKLPRLQDLDYFVRFSRIGGKLESPQEAPALCDYFKSDIGRDHAEVAQSAERIFQKNRIAYESYGAGFVSRVTWKNAWLAARFAKHNNAYAASAGYILRGILRTPRYALYRIRRRILSST